MRLTSKGRYAVRAILDLTFNSNGKPVRLQEISERQKISLHYLEQLFRRLRKGNVVKSVRGPGGGYLLSRSMDDIAVKDVLLSVGENINPARDIVGPADMKESTIEFVLTKSYFENLATLMQEYLATTTLGDLIRKAKGEGRTTTQQNIGADTIEADAIGIQQNVNRNLETDLS
ncbi:MAG: Rrf2 family transcriptional regulator [Oligoflexia bacterium]|nr:Rrf2 family transcriptional regulator [Oligoflexia bacterium]